MEKKMIVLNALGGSTGVQFAAVEQVHEMSAVIGHQIVVLGAVVAIAALCSMGLIWFSLPWLAHHAIARPNARSSHRQPTPQGGGFAVVAVTLAIVWAAILLLPAQNQTWQFLALTAATGLLGVVGAIDDMRQLSAPARLAFQSIAVAIVIVALPSKLQILPHFPWWIERLCLFVGGLWFVNLVNFMDGIDWMTVAEVVPVTAAIVLLGLCGAIELLPSLVAAALLGAILGFAPFNKPVARLFLGDVGSLPIGLVLGWLLLQLAARGYLVAALILPLYYLVDATITLTRRVAKGERFWEAHRTHFYQRATDNGFSVPAIVAHVVAVNLALAALALLTVVAHNLVVSLIASAISIAIVAWLLMTFGRAKR
jgi:UDP-N-acetylmuramyl pentapeptide phosphotransferase/UDP-N-acetylglucosamine-1-phosphate transferase